MRETSFIKQNKKKWKEFEEVMDGQYEDPDKMNDLFIQITDDLSYSRTFYPNRSVRVYLNGLAQKIFFRLYKNRRSRSRRLISFWTDELPQLVYESRRDFIISFLIFGLACGIGVLSSIMDPDFARVILGDSYVEMTLENIDSGDPMAVYKQKGQFGMWMGITANNLFVSFLTFVMGTFFGVGTIAVLISNGIMLGSFQYFFMERGLFMDSFLTIWIHGTLEISAIIIAGAAGLTMARGLIFPGTYTRTQSFQRSARRGVKIMIGIVPIIAMAGFFEGFLTRHTETPDLIRALFIFLCLAFVVFYFILYPWYKSRIGFEKPILDTDIAPGSDQKLDFQRIKSGGDIFSEVFIFFRRYMGRFALLSLATTLIYVTSVFLISDLQPNTLFIFPEQMFSAISMLDQYFVNDERWLFLSVNTITLTILATGVLSLIYKEANKESQKPWLGGLLVIVPIAAIMLVIGTDDWYTFFLFLFFAPVCLLWASVNFFEKRDPVTGLARTFSFTGRYYGKTFSLLLLLFLVGLMFFTISDTFLFLFYFRLISWIVSFEQSVMDNISAIALTSFGIYVLHLISIIIFTGFGLLYYSLLEVTEAPGLREKIQSIGMSRKIRGLERE